MPELTDIAAKVRADARLSADDGVRLFRSADLHTLGELANFVRERRHGRATCYNINRHINYTNYCLLRCRFCSFCRPYRKETSDGYQLTVEQVVEQARQASEAGATEIHIVGGLHPELPFEYYLDICREIRRACPRLHIKAFTAVEIVHFARIARPRLSVGEVLEQLRAAGLDSLPGGGAEIFDPRVHEEAFKNKVGEEGWFDVHRVAHEMGIFTNATMLFGHIESVEERVNHLLKLRAHQDASLAERSSHFNCVVPLPFIPSGSGLADLPGPSGLDCLRTLAVTRLLIDNIPHIKAFWIMLTPKLAQVSLNWGVDDLDGTVVWYDITKAGGNTHQEMTVTQLRALITEAGGVPVERNSLYRPIIRDQDNQRVIMKDRP